MPNETFQECTSLHLIYFSKPTMTVIDCNLRFLQFKSDTILVFRFNARFFLVVNRLLCWWWLVSLTVTRVTKVSTLPSLTVVFAHKLSLNWPVLLKTHWAELPSDSSLQTASFLMTIKASAQMTHHVFLSFLSSPSHMATRWICYK